MTSTLNSTGRLALYTRYAFRSFLRGRSRSLFGSFCVAVGIASVIALGVVVGNFRNAVDGNARQINRGDLSISPSGYAFTREQVQIFSRLLAAGQITGYTLRFQDDSSLRSTTRNLSTVGTLTAVDPAKFPFYDTIKAIEPAGASLQTLLSRPDSTVVSQDTLTSLHLKVGDQITVNSRRGFDRAYTIAGVVPDNAPDPGFGAGL